MITCRIHSTRWLKRFPPSSRAERVCNTSDRPLLRTCLKLYIILNFTIVFMYSVRIPWWSAFFLRFPQSFALYQHYRCSSHLLVPPLLRCCTNCSISTLPTSSTWTRPCLWRPRCWSSDTSGPVCGRRDVHRKCWTWTTNRTGCCWSPLIRTTSACSSGRPYKSCRKWKTCTYTLCACLSVIYVICQRSSDDANWNDRWPPWCFRRLWR